MLQTIPIENGQQVSVIITSIISLVLVAVTVGLRLLAKHIRMGFDYADLCAVGALIANTALHTMLLLLVTYGGFGFHVKEIYARFGAENATFFFKGIMSFAILWNVTVCFSKLSVLLMYTALFTQESLLRWSQGVGIIIILWNISNILAAFLICQPIARNWNFAIPGHCGSQPNFYLAMGAVNIISDVIILALPLPYLYRLQMAWKRKVLAMSMLSIGVGTWVITIYRQTLLPGLDFADMTHSGVLATLLSGLEPSVAIALSCLPLMRPLFVRKKNDPMPYGTYGTGNSKRQITTDGDSEIHLRAMEGGQGEIVVHKSWEVRSASQAAN